MFNLHGDFFFKTINNFKHIIKENIQLSEIYRFLVENVGV